MVIYTQCINNSELWAQWMVAIGTILLAMITVVIHLMGDSHTRLLKQKYSYDFKQKAYDFLSTSLASWGHQAPVPTSPEISVEDNINNFRQAILDNQFYLSCWNLQRFKKYTNLAREAASAWDTFSGNHDKRLKAMRNIAKAMKELSSEIGKEKDIENQATSYPEFF